MITGQVAHYRLIDAVIAAIKDQIEDEGQALLSGVAEDWPAYRHRLGRLAGLAEAIEIAEAQIKKYQES